MFVNPRRHRREVGEDGRDSRPRWPQGELQEVAFLEKKKLILQLCVIYENDMTANSAPVFPFRDMVEIPTGTTVSQHRW